MNIHDKDNWLVGAVVNKTTDVSPEDMEQLLILAEEDNKWLKNVKEEVMYYDTHPIRNRQDFFRDYIGTLNIEGTIVPSPFGYTRTFDNRRHLFRGENQQYSYSESTLSRRCRRRDGSFRPKRERELIHVLANLRIIQFRKFLMQFESISGWEDNGININYKALAQHYGFETFLLDLTNNVMDALFFATCKWIKDHFEPLDETDINKSEETKYGILYHTPMWKANSINCFGELNNLLSEDGILDIKNIRPIDSGDWDGQIIQIGQQPLYRAHSQFGYVYPMKNIKTNICTSNAFERIRFRHNEEFCKRIYEKMQKGKAIYPDEGINMVIDIVKKIQGSFIFSEADCDRLFESDEVDREVLATKEDLKAALESEEMTNLITDAYGLNDRVKIIKDEVAYNISEEQKSDINHYYNERPLDIRGYAVQCETYISKK